MNTSLTASALAAALGLLPSAALGQMTIHPSVEIRFPTVDGTYYQVRKSDDGQDWHNVGMPLPGDGSTKSMHFSTTANRSQLYRVEEIPSPSVVQVDPLSYYNPFGVWVYDKYTDGTGPKTGRLFRSLGTTTKDGTPMILLQEYDAHGTEDDQIFLDTRVSGAVLAVGGHGDNGDWFWSEPVPHLLGTFVPGQTYRVEGLQRSEFPGALIDHTIQMDLEQVVVPAGSFDCIKVTRTLVLHAPGGPGAPPGTYQVISWYAKHTGMVKRIGFTGSLWELTRYDNHTP